MSAVTGIRHPRCSSGGGRVRIACRKQGKGGSNRDEPSEREIERGRETERKGNVEERCKREEKKGGGRQIDVRSRERKKERKKENKKKRTKERKKKEGNEKKKKENNREKWRGVDKVRINIQSH